MKTKHFLCSALGLHVIKKETLVHVFLCEFCKNFWEQIFYRTASVDASVVLYETANKITVNREKRILEKIELTFCVI